MPMSCGGGAKGKRLGAKDMGIDSKADPTQDAKRDDDDGSDTNQAVSTDDEWPRQEGLNRFVLYPIRHPKVWQMYRKHLACFWTAAEVDLSHDARHWSQLTDDEQRFLTEILAFFAGSDGIVLDNLLSRFLVEVQVPEARCFYAFQAAMENVHAEMYALLLDTLVPDERVKMRAFRAVEESASIREKTAWARYWIREDNDESYAERVVAFAAVEGIFFSSSFAAIFWIKQRGILPGLTFSNELISRDEGLHTQFACLNHAKLPPHKQCSPAQIQAIVEDAVRVEQRFMARIMDSCHLPGLSATSMQDYVEFVGDVLLTMFGVAKLWHTKNPFPWMEMISLQGKTNFFERRVGEYQRAGVMVDRRLEASSAGRNDLTRAIRTNPNVFTLTEPF